MGTANVWILGGYQSDFGDRDPRDPVVNGKVDAPSTASTDRR